MAPDDGGFARIEKLACEPGADEVGMKLETPARGGDGSGCFEGGPGSADGGDLPDLV